MAHFQRIAIRRKQVPIGAAAVALYYTLCEYDNELFWMDMFTVPNGVIAAYAGLSLDTLKRARVELVEKGYIEYQHGAGNQAGKYLIVDFAPQIAPQTTPQAAPHTTPQSAPQHTNIQNKDKDENKESIGAPTARTPASRFVPPSVEEVAAYCQERRNQGKANNVDPERFCDYYATQGWVLSNGQKMKDWQGAVRNWEKRDSERPTGTGGQHRKALDFDPDNPWGEYT